MTPSLALGTAIAVSNQSSKESLLEAWSDDRVQSSLYVLALYSSLCAVLAAVKRLESIVPDVQDLPCLH